MKFQICAISSVSLLTRALRIGSAVAGSGSSPYLNNFSHLSDDGLYDHSTVVSPELHRQVVGYPRDVAAGTVVIDTAQTDLYNVLGNGKAIRTPPL